MVEYIHYGHTEFSKELFQPIKNREMFAKPTGGFWASRLNSLYGWDCDSILIMNPNIICVKED